MAKMRTSYKPAGPVTQFTADSLLAQEGHFFPAPGTDRKVLTPGGGLMGPPAPAVKVASPVPLNGQAGYPVSTFDKRPGSSIDKQAVSALNPRMPTRSNPSGLQTSSFEDRPPGVMPDALKDSPTQHLLRRARDLDQRRQRLDAMSNAVTTAEKQAAAEGRVLTDYDRLRIRQRASLMESIKQGHNVGGAEVGRSNENQRPLNPRMSPQDQININTRVDQYETGARDFRRAESEQKKKLKKNRRMRD